MPHSVSPNDSPAREDQDEVLPDAPPADSTNGGAKEEPEVDGSENAKTGVKLEDLFNDDDDDDEFPASSAVDSKMQSSPPAEPAA